MAIARAMDRIEAADEDADLGDPDHNRADQFEAYEKTLRTLERVTPADDDEEVIVLTRWIVEQIEGGKRPSSRSVRQRATKFCRANGYAVEDDDWLGA